MSDSKRPHLEDRIDRFVRGELSTAESRELAQKSLDDQELFENLTYTAVAKAGLAVPDPKVVRFPWKARFWAGAAAAAAIIVIALYFVRTSQPPVARTREVAQARQLTASLAASAKPGQPVLLASGLEPQSRQGDHAPVFRGPAPESRAPRAAGSILSIDGGLATIDLGSLDGIAKGGDLAVFLDKQSAAPIGRLIVTTVFRERARGQIVDGNQIQAGSSVRVPGAVYLGAVFERVETLAGRGDSLAARTMAEQAVRWAETAHAAPAERARALQKLAALEYQMGSLAAAEQHYRAAAEIWNAAPPGPRAEQTATLNNLAVLRLLRGDLSGAEAPLSQALSQSNDGSSLNNSGVLAELRGDKRKAESLYANALRAFEAQPAASAQERQSVERNLGRVRSSR